VLGSRLRKPFFFWRRRPTRRGAHNPSSFLPPPKTTPTTTKQQNLDSGIQEAPYMFNIVAVMTTFGAVLMFLGFLVFAYRRRLIAF